MRDCFLPDERIVRKNLRLLGFNHLTNADVTEVLRKALVEYTPSSVEVVHFRLTWPEFIIVTAYRLGFTSTDAEIEARIDCLKSIGTVGGMARQNWGINQYLTWNGWITL